MSALCLAVVVGLLPGAASAQTPPPPGAQTAASPRLRVFLDCECFQAFLREEIDWVDYVRQVQDADVQILSNTTGTGGGGREVVLRFIGRGRFAGIDHELKSVTLAGDTEDTRRRAMVRTVTVGLLVYMARSGLPPHLDVSVEAGNAPPAANARDPWRLWVFGIELEGSLSAQETSRDSAGNVNISADRVSAAWKVSFGASTEHQEERFTILDDEDPTESGEFRTVRRNTSVEGLVVKSLGPHWSFGAAKAKGRHSLRSCSAADRNAAGGPVHCPCTSLPD